MKETESLKLLTDEGLNKMLFEARVELMRARSVFRAGILDPGVPAENTNRVKQLRKRIARILTLKRERELVK